MDGFNLNRPSYGGFGGDLPPASSTAAPPPSSASPAEYEVVAEVAGPPRETPGAWDAWLSIPEEGRVAIIVVAAVVLLGLWGYLGLWLRRRCGGEPEVPDLEAAATRGLTPWPAARPHQPALAYTAPLPLTYEG